MASEINSPINMARTIGVFESALELAISNLKDAQAGKPIPQYRIDWLENALKRGTIIFDNRLEDTETIDNLVKDTYEF